MMGGYRWMVYAASSTLISTFNKEPQVKTEASNLLIFSK